MFSSRKPTQKRALWQWAKEVRQQFCWAGSLSSLVACASLSRKVIYINVLRLKIWLGAVTSELLFTNFPVGLGKARILIAGERERLWARKQ